MSATYKYHKHEVRSHFNMKQWRSLKSNVDLHLGEGCSPMEFAVNAASHQVRYYCKILCYHKSLKTSQKAFYFESAFLFDLLVVVENLSFSPYSFIRMLIQELETLNTSFQGRGQALFLSLMTKRATFTPQRLWTEKNRPSTHWPPRL